MVKVNVTQELIDADGHSAFSCPIAKAIKEAVGNEYSEVSVTGAYTSLYPVGIDYWGNAEQVTTIYWPRAIQNWLSNYDATRVAHDPIVPFSFDLDIESHVIRSIEGI